MIYTAKKGINATMPKTPEEKGSWNSSWLIFAGFIIYQSYLWGVQSLFKQAIGLTPECVYDPQPPYDDDEEVESPSYFADLFHLSGGSLVSDEQLYVIL
jgi:hypothetical protein